MRDDNKILITYAIEDIAFEEARVMYIAGKEDAGKGDLGTIVLPKPARDVSIDPELPDAVVFSYTNTEEDIIRLRVVLVKINSKAGELSKCTVSVLVPSVDGNWVPRTRDVTLVKEPPPNAGAVSDPEPDYAIRNPHGLAQAGDYLYFIDYETHLIAIIGKDELEAAADGAELAIKVCDLADDLEMDNPRGQGIIALGGKIYALFNDTDLDPAEEYEPSRLVRLGIDSGTGELDFDAKILVGKNAQSIVPVMRKEADVDVVYLLVPARGGQQYYEGQTNGTDSNICAVKAAGGWSTLYPSGTAPVVVTGDVYPNPAPDPPPEATAYDIHALGAAMRNGDSQLFILTQVYTDDAKSAFWMLYQISVNDFLNFLDKSGDPYTLTEAKDHGLDLTDEGIVEAPDPTFADAIYFWDILYEQTLRNDDDEDRLWLLLGSPFLVTKAEAYGSPSTPLANPFVMFSGFGGINVNSVDLTIETLHQAQREVSLKRGTRAAKLTASMGRAGVAATAISGAEEEEEEEK